MAKNVCDVTTPLRLDSRCYLCAVEITRRQDHLETPSDIRTYETPSGIRTYVRSGKEGFLTRPPAWRCSNVKRSQIDDFYNLYVNCLIMSNGTVELMDKFCPCYERHEAKPTKALAPSQIDHWYEAHHVCVCVCRLAVIVMPSPLNSSPP